MIVGVDKLASLNENTKVCIVATNASFLEHRWYLKDCCTGIAVSDNSVTDIYEWLLSKFSLEEKIGPHVVMMDWRSVELDVISSELLPNLSKVRGIYTCVIVELDNEGPWPKELKRRFWWTPTQSFEERIQARDISKCFLVAYKCMPDGTRVDDENMAMGTIHLEDLFLEFTFKAELRGKYGS